MTDDSTKPTEQHLREVRTHLIKTEFGFDPYKATNEDLIHYLATAAYRMNQVRKDLGHVQTAINQAKQGK